MNQFGKRIKTLRLAKGLSQVELAVRLGIGRSTPAQWERGTLPFASTIPKLARILGVEPEELAELWMADSLEREEK